MKGDTIATFVIDGDQILARKSVWQRRKREELKR